MPLRFFFVLACLLFLPACNDFNLRYMPVPQPPFANLFADYTLLHDSIGISVDTDGLRLEEIYIKKSDGAVVRPHNIIHPSFYQSASIGTGIGIGGGNVGVGTGIGVPVGPERAAGLTTATFSNAAIGDPPWELHIKVTGVPEAVIPAFGGPPNAK